MYWKKKGVEHSVNCEIMFSNESNKNDEKNKEERGGGKDARGKAKQEGRE